MFYLEYTRTSILWEHFIDYHYEHKKTDFIYIMYYHVSDFKFL